MADCRDFFSLTGRRVSFEYTLMAGVNDGAEQVLCHVRIMSTIVLLTDATWWLAGRKAELTF